MDIAAHVRSGAAPRVGFIELATATDLLPPAPLFLLGQPSAVVLDELFGRTSLHAVGCYTIENAAVGPTGIALKDGIAFSSESFIHPPHHVAAVAARLRAAELPARHVRGPLAVIYGPGHETYGHWLVDFLPRLWVLRQSGFDIHTLRYAVPPDLSKIAAELLARIGIRQSQLVPYRYWREVLRTDLLLMPTGLRAGNLVSPLFAQASTFWTAPLLRQAAHAPSAARRVFLSRAGQPAARMLIERATAEDCAREHGYLVVRPETLGLIEQVALFAGADVLAGEYGSALHGTVFAARDTVALGFRGNLRHPSFVQSGVAGSLGQHVGYILGETKGDVVQIFSIAKPDMEKALTLAHLSAQKPATA